MRGDVTESYKDNIAFGDREVVPGNKTPLCPSDALVASPLVLGVY